MTKVAMDPSNEVTMSIHSQVENQGPWMRHASSKLNKEQNPHGFVVEGLASIKARMQNPIDAMNWHDIKGGYTALSSLGYMFGPHFQCLKHGWMNNAEFLGIFETSEEVFGE